MDKIQARFLAALDKAVIKGVEKFEQAEIGTPLYDRILNQLILTLGVIQKIAPTTSPKQEEK